MQRWEERKPAFQKIVEGKQFEYSGFVIFQCGSYDDEERWKRYKAKFEKVFFDEIITRTREIKLLERMGFIWIEDEAFRKASAGEAAE